MLQRNVVENAKFMAEWIKTLETIRYKWLVKKIKKMNKRVLVRAGSNHTYLSKILTQKGVRHTRIFYEKQTFGSFLERCTK